jgi:DNA-binding transcriptional regulator YiaG
METETAKMAASWPPKAGTNGRSGELRKPVNQKKKVASAARKAPPRVVVARSLRTDFGLSLSTFSKMVGVPSKVLTAWEANQVSLKGAAAARLKRVSTILARLAGIMQPAFVPKWLERPNNACQEIGVRSPLHLFEEGDYETIEDMIWYAESGTPG